MRFDAATRRRVTLWAGVVIVATVGLGPTDLSPSAKASCAGPQIMLSQRDTPMTPSRVGAGAKEKVVYPVDPSLELIVSGYNLTLDCFDPDGTPGCLPPPNPDKRAQPMRDAVLTLRQHGRKWKLADVGEIGSDLRATIVVHLPSAAVRGRAVLELRDPHEQHGTQQQLDLT